MQLCGGIRYRHGIDINLRIGMSASLKCCIVFCQLTKAPHIHHQHAMANLADYRKVYRERQGTEPPPPLTGDLMFCHEDAGRAEELARRYIAEYLRTILGPHALMSAAFQEIERYDHYGSAVDLFQQVGLDTSLESYVNVQTWGTPEMIVERLRARRELLGDYELNLVSWYGSMPLEEAEASVSLFAREALPALRRG